MFRRDIAVRPALETVTDVFHHRAHRLQCSVASRYRLEDVDVDLFRNLLGRTVGDTEDTQIAIVAAAEAKELKRGVGWPRNCPVGVEDVRVC